MEAGLHKHNISSNTKSRTEIKNFPKFKFWCQAVYESVIDRYYHVNTTKEIRLKEHDNLVNFMYAPYPYRDLNLLFKEYPFEEEDGFVDIGCGKGRVLVKASLFGCRNIYGVDLSKELLTTANTNMVVCQRNNPGMHYELLCMNAKNYTFSSDINKVFMHNPFTLKIGIKVIKALMTSIQESPREVILFLAGSPSLNKYVEMIEGVEIIGRGKNNLCIYRYTPKMKKG